MRWTQEAALERSTQEPALERQHQSPRVHDGVVRLGNKPRIFKRNTVSTKLTKPGQRPVWGWLHRARRVEDVRGSKLQKTVPYSRTLPTIRTTKVCAASAYCTCGRWRLSPGRAAPVSSSETPPGSSRKVKGEDCCRLNKLTSCFDDREEIFLGKLVLVLHNLLVFFIPNPNPKLAIVGFSYFL